jgi:hypothetical protein
MVINLKQQKLTFNNKPIGVIQRTNAVEQSLLGVAAEAEKLSNIALQEMKLASTEAGEKAARTMPMEKFYTLNADGDFEAYDTKEFQDLGANARRSFKTLANKKFMRSIQKDIEVKHKELALKYKDVAGGDELYANVFGAYVDTLVDNSPAEFKDIIKNDGIDTLTLGKANIQAGLRETSNLASMRMIEEEFISLASKYNQAKRQGDEMLMAGIRAQLENVVTSSKELENTFGQARVKGLAQSYSRKIANLDLSSTVAKLYSEEGLSKLDVDNMHGYLLSGGTYIGENLQSNPEQLADLNDILNSTEGWQMDSLVALSTKYKELTKQIITSSQPSSSSKRQETNEILSIVNTDIEGLRNIPYSSETVNALEKKFEQLSTDNNDAFNSEKLLQKKGYLAKTATIRLAKEVKRIKDSNGDILPSGAWEAITLYLQDGDERNLRSYIDIGGNSVDFDEPTRKKVIEFFNKVASTNVLSEDNIGQIRTAVANYSNTRKLEESRIEANVQKKENELKIQGKREELLKYELEKGVIEDELFEVRTDEDVTDAVKTIDDFIKRFSNWATESGAKNVGTIVNADRARLEQVLGKQINKLVAGEVAKSVALEPNQIEEQGIFVLNAKKSTDLKNFLSYVRNPNEELKSKIKPEYLAAYEKYYERDDLQLEPVRTDLETSISQLIALTISEQSGRQEALNEANDMNNIIKGTLKRDEKASRLVDNILFEALVKYNDENNLGLIDKDKTIEENMKGFYFSEESLKKNPVTDLMYKLIGEGYLPHQFVDGYNMMGGAEESVLKAMDTHRINLESQPSANGRKVSYIGYKGTNKFAGNYGFKSINDSFKELRTINHILRFRAGGNQQAFNLLDNEGIGMPTERTATMVQYDAPYSDLLNSYSEITNDQMNDAFKILKKQLNIKTLYSPTEANREIIIKDLINSTEIFGPAKDNKAALSLFQPPQEIIDIAEHFWSVAAMDAELRNDKSGLKQYYSQFKTMLTEYMDTNYMESDGNVLDFSNMHTLSTTHTRLHPAIHLGEAKYLAMVDYVNDRLPPNMVFDFNAVQTDEFLKKYKFSRQTLPTDEVYAQINTLPTQFKRRYAKELKAGKDISEKIFKERLKEEAKKEGIDKVVLVAYETANANEIIYQAMRVTANETLTPVIVTNTKGDALPFVFSLGSLAAAFDKDGVYDNILREQLRPGVERREQIEQGLNETGTDALNRFYGLFVR